MPPESVGPSPIPESLYATRQMPGRVVVRWALRTLVGLGVLVGACLLLIALLYRLPNGGPLLRFWSHVLPLPAMRVDDQWVLYRSYEEHVRGWQQYYETQGSALEPDVIRERVRTQITRHALAQGLAQELEVVVDEAVVDALEQQLRDQYGGQEAFEAVVEQRYGWDRSLFRTYVLEPLALQQALEPVIAASELWQEGVRLQIEEVQQEVEADPTLFTDRVLALSTSPSVESGGELGLRPVQEYPPEAQGLLIATEEGAVTPVVELETRFVVYRLLAYDAADELLNAQELAIDKTSVHDVIDRRQDEADIRLYRQK